MSQISGLRGLATTIIITGTAGEGWWNATNRRHEFLLVLAALLATSGCLQATDVTSPSSSMRARATVDPSPEQPIEAPSWVVGEWWKWSVSFAGYAPFEIETSVSKADPDAYVVATTDVTSYAHALSLHLVPIGRVQRSDLSWDAHGLPVSLLRFPLTDGQSWETNAWLGNDLKVQVRKGPVKVLEDERSGLLVNVTFPDGRTALEADYSPQVGQFVRISAYWGPDHPLSTATLVAYGYDRPGSSSFLARDLLRTNATTTGAPWVPPGPFTVPAVEGVVVVACFLGGVAPLSFGAYVEAPNGQLGQCVASNSLSTSPRLTRMVVPMGATAGPWAAEIMLPPAGFVYLEVFLAERVT